MTELQKWTLILNSPNHYLIYILNFRIYLDASSISTILFNINLLLMADLKYYALRARYRVYQYGLFARCSHIFNALGYNKFSPNNLGFSSH
jgi:hypothetical protein